MEHEFYECPEYLANTAAAVERTEEYEYEVKLGVFLLNSGTLGRSGGHVCSILSVLRVSRNKRPAQQQLATC